MQRPRRPAPGRRPGQRRRFPRAGAAVGVPRRATARPGRMPVRPAGRLRSTALTTRAAVLGLVVCALLVSAALPLREYLSQRSRIGELEQEQAAARERVEELEHAKQQLQDPAYIAAEARRRLRMAKPGETTYVLLAPTPEASDDDHPATAALSDDPDAPWYSQVWDSVRTADRPEQAEAAAP